MIEITNEDNMLLMARYPDKYFDLAIVDPPYGIGANKMTLGNGKKKVNRGMSDWDNAIPSKEYFEELFRVSKNQVIWGGNYFTEHLKPSSSWLFWDKGTGENDFSDGELAWTSFGGALRKISKSWVGANAKDGIERIHPTQKPIYLYEWILSRYGNIDYKVIDTHLGSGSIAIACHNYKYDLVSCELDPTYFASAMKRLQQHQSQTKLF